MYEFAAACEDCGAKWRFVADEEPDYVECTACGATTYRIELIGSRFVP